MSIKAALLVVGSIEVLVVYKDIKNLHLSLMPPAGAVRVSAPVKTRNDVIRSFVATKSSWIKKRQQQYRNQRRQTKREYVSGETHYYLGKPFMLSLVATTSSNKLSIKGKSQIVLSAKTSATTEQKERVFTEWYRIELRKELKKLIIKWQPKISATPKHWRIQRMKTRWGSCNPKNSRVLINLELIKKPHQCIEYVVVHEWLHLIEPMHDEKFVALLDKYLPKWRQTRDELNRIILTHEEW